MSFSRSCASGERAAERRARARGTDRPRRLAPHARRTPARALVLLVRGEPVRVHLPLAQRLLEVSVEPLARDRQRADERLVDEQLLPRVVEAAELRVPRGDALAPLRRRATERDDARTHVGRALRVVRVRRQQVAREALGTPRIRLVELRRARPEARRVAADLVQRREAEVAVERRVLDPLRHHRAGRLLEAHDELLVAGRPRAGGCRRSSSETFARPISSPVGILDDALVRLDVRAVDVERRERERQVRRPRPPRAAGAAPARRC